MVKSSRNRVLWIDNMRGFSVIFVMLLHVSIISGTDENSNFYIINYINSSLKPFRLGLMFFVSGLFVTSGLNKGIHIFIHRKIKSILYPFIIWSVIYSLAFIISANKLKDPSAYVHYAVSHLSGGGDTTWFLQSLFLFFMAIIFLKKVPYYLVIPTCWLIYIFLPPISSLSLFSTFDNYHINKNFYLFPFFYLGYLLSDSSNKNIEIITHKYAIIISMFSYFFIAILYTRGYHIFNILSISAIPFFVYLAKSKIFVIFNYIGSRSISFYLPHYLVLILSNKIISICFPSPSSGKYIVLFICTLTGSFIITYLRKINIIDCLFVSK